MPDSHRLAAAFDVLDRFEGKTGPRRRRRPTWDELSLHLDADTIDPIFDRMTARRKAEFLDFTRAEIWFFDSALEADAPDPFDVETRRVVGAWVHRQPYAWYPLAPLPRGHESMTLGFFEMLHRLLPHLVTRSVDELCAELQPIWPTVYFPALRANVAPHLDVLEAACRERNEDPTPWRRLVAA